MSRKKSVATLAVVAAGVAIAGLGTAVGTATAFFADQASVDEPQSVATATIPELSDLMGSYDKTTGSVGVSWTPPPFRTDVAPSYTATRTLTPTPPETYVLPELSIPAGNDTAGFTDLLEVTAPDGVQFVSVTAGGSHSCGLTASGEAYCWGLNYYGQLGDGSEPGDLSPVLIPTAVAGGHTFQSISAGRYYTCGVAAGGEAFCWGNNQYGQQGNSTTENSNRPVAVESDPSNPLTFKTISTSERTTCGIVDGDNAYCWGYNVDGQLGNGANERSLTPVLVQSTETWKTVSVGVYHTCGITSDETAYCWGNNNVGQLGNGTTELSNVPVAVTSPLPDPPDFETISAGGRFTCGTTSGETYCWGSNQSGELGANLPPGTTSSLPVTVVNGGDFRSVTAFGFNACAESSDGTAYCWGYNGDGQLGNGINTNSSAPVPVKSDPNDPLTFRTLAAGYRHTCGISSGGSTLCWGFNEYGQLGNGNTDNSNVPGRVSGVGASCETGWDLTADETKCVPGNGIRIEYNINYDKAGWASSEQTVISQEGVTP